MTCSAMPITIEINAADQPHKIDRTRLKKAVRLILKDAGISAAEISIAVVTDQRMQQLNREYLKHDYATDVLSFVLAHDAKAHSLEGEIIASSEYAAAQAPRYGWSLNDELLLYVIHGCLHLVGHDDMTAPVKRVMRRAEKKYLNQFGLERR
jgi:probable rRNA maturation factor